MLPLDDLLLIFMPLFVAFNVFGVLPIFISMTINLELEEKRQLTYQAILTAGIVATVFLFSGKSIFDLMGITTDDLRVGGGILLFVIALMDLISSNEEKRRAPSKEIAIVPIGIPLILGPASLTTILILDARYGHWLTLASVFINLLIIFLVFFFSKIIIRVLGKGGSMALGKIASLLLLAISVMMIRVGIKNFIDSM